jgi:hypothetical protein
MHTSLRTDLDRVYIKQLRSGYGSITCRLQKVLETLYNQDIEDAIQQIKKIQLFSCEYFYEQIEKESIEEGWGLMKEGSKRF